METWFNDHLHQLFYCGTLLKSYLQLDGKMGRLRFGMNIIRSFMIYLVFIQKALQPFVGVVMAIELHLVMR